MKTRFHVLDLKSEIFAGIYFREFSGFCYNQNRKLFYYKGIAPYITLKIRMFKYSCFSQLYVIHKETETCSKSMKTKETLELL